MRKVKSSGLRAGKTLLGAMLALSAATMFGAAGAKAADSVKL